MKILIDARSMGTKPSGIGMYIYNFAKELVKEPDMEIHLLSDVATSNEMQAMEQAGAILHCYGTPVGKNFGLVKYYRYLQKVIHEIRPEISRIFALISTFQSPNDHYNHSQHMTHWASV